MDPITPPASPPAQPVTGLGDGSSPVFSVRGTINHTANDSEISVTIDRLPTADRAPYQGLNATTCTLSEGQDTAQWKRFQTREWDPAASRSLQTEELVVQIEPGYDGQGPKVISGAIFTTDLGDSGLAQRKTARSVDPYDTDMSSLPQIGTDAQGKVLQVGEQSPGWVPHELTNTTALPTGWELDGPVWLQRDPATSRSRGSRCTLEFCLRPETTEE